MAKHTVIRPYERKCVKQTLRSGFAIAGFILCFGAAGQSVSDEPPPNEPAQWRQSIERPSRSWDYDGKRILGHIGYDICLWDAETGELLHRMKGHKERIHTVQLSPDGNHALSSSWMDSGPMVMQESKDTRTILWNLSTGQEREIFKGEVAGEFSPDGRRIITFSQRPDKVETTYEYTNSETGEVQLNKSIVPVTRFDNASVWDTFTGRQLVKAKLDKHSDPGKDALHFSPDGRSFVHIVNGAFLLYNASGGVVFNTSDGREIGRVARATVRSGGGHRYTLNGALASFEPTKARLIDLKSGRVVRSIQHDLKAIWGVAWTHDGGSFAAIPPGDGEIKIWDIESGEIITGAKSGPYPKRAAVISPDNSRLAVEWGGTNNTEPGLGIYDMSTGVEISRVKLAKWGKILGFSPDGKTLLVGGSEFVIYNSENGEAVRTLKLIDDVGSRDWDK